MNWFCLMNQKQSDENNDSYELTLFSESETYSSTNVVWLKLNILCTHSTIGPFRFIWVFSLSLHIYVYILYLAICTERDNNQINLNQ